MDAKLEVLSVRWQVWIDPGHSISLMCSSFMAILGLNRAAFVPGSRKVALIEKLWVVSWGVSRVGLAACAAVVVVFISVGDIMETSVVSSPGVGTARMGLGLPGCERAGRLRVSGRFCICSKMIL